MSDSQHTHRRKNHSHETNRHAIVAITDRSSQPTSDLFSIDRKGDIQNLRYGSIDKYKVPRYRTVGYGGLLGLDRRYKIVSNTSTERKIDDVSIDWGNRNRLARESPLNQRGHFEEDQKPVQRSLAGQDDFLEQQDFVSLGRKRRRLSEAVRSTNHSSVENAFDPFHEIPSDSTTTSSSSANGEETQKNLPDDDAFQKFKNHPDNKKSIELRKRTSEHPQDVAAWLELIEHQDRFYCLSAGEIRHRSNNAQQRAVSDMRISLYEKAIASVRDKHAKEKLMLGLMKEGSKLWDVDRQTKEWKVVLHQAQSLELWFGYLTFQQTNAILFSYDKCFNTYLEIWKLPPSKDSREDTHRGHQRIYLILRLTSFMFESGFPERAIAIWQALLEYNFFSPTTKYQSSDAFAAFWETEFARIGEKDAKGWSFNGEQEVPTYEDRPLEELLVTNVFSGWASDEARRSLDDIMPARTLDDVTEDDPYRVIVFADVKDFIFRIDSPEAEQILIQAFLKFCRLPAMYNDTIDRNSWWHDVFLCDFAPKLLPGGLADTGTLFAQVETPLYMWNTSASKGKGLLDFAATALMQLVESGNCNDHLAEYVIALQLHNDSKFARKWTKSMLKRRPNSLLLYNAYALLEQRSGKADTAANVWSTALSMANSLGQQAQSDTIILWHSWIWELMSQRRHMFVRSLIATVLPAEMITTALLENADGIRDISAAQRLKSDAYLREQISIAMNHGGDKVVEFADVYAISQYLSHGCDITQAINVYQSTMSLLGQQRFRHLLERLHQCRARLLHLHTSLQNSGYHPMQLVHILRESTSCFPDNPLFMILHEKYLQSAGIIERLRMRETENGIAKNVVVESLQVIARELSRPLYAGSTTHSIRRAFTQATMDENPAAHLPVIWLLWIRWELSLIPDQPGTLAGRARNVYLSAIRSCPWHKELYLIGLTEGLLSAELGPEGFEQVYRTMLDRGIRIRHDITEALDDKD